MMKVDELLMKLGVFLGGLGILIIALLISYETFKSPRSYDLNMYCDRGYVVLTANKDIYNVSVIFNGSVVCSYDAIKKDNQELCRINANESVPVMITYDDKKRVVWCYRPYSLQYD